MYLIYSTVRNDYVLVFIVSVDVALSEQSREWNFHSSTNHVKVQTAANGYTFCEK